MKSIILVCVVCLQLGQNYGLENADGVGAFAYDGPSGRYGGIYGLKDGKVVNQQGTFPPDFTPPTFQDFDDFFPDYFNNLENILQETFDSVENQRLAFSAATKAFDLTTNRAGSTHFFAPPRFPFGGNFPGFDGFPGAYPGRNGYQGNRYPGYDMSNYGNYQNSAFAGAALGPNYRAQMAGINPENPSNPNINKFSSVGGQPNGYKSVSSSSVATSHTDSAGNKIESRRAETTINDNGVITKYEVKS